MAIEFSPTIPGLSTAPSDPEIYYATSSSRSSIFPGSNFDISVSFWINIEQYNPTYTEYWSVAGLMDSTDHDNYRKEFGLFFRSSEVRLNFPIWGTFPGHNPIYTNSVGNIYINGVDQGASTSYQVASFDTWIHVGVKYSVSNHSHDRFFMNYNYDVTSSSVNVRVAELGVWPVSLTDSEFLILSKKACPLHVRKDVIAIYSRCSRNANDIFCNQETYNSVSPYSHPLTINYNSGPKTGFGDAVKTGVEVDKWAAPKIIPMKPREKRTFYQIPLTGTPLDTDFTVDKWAAPPSPIQRMPNRITSYQNPVFGGRAEVYPDSMVNVFSKEQYKPKPGFVEITCKKPDTASLHDKADSVKIWFTGASSYAGAQAAQASSLGNYRSTTEADRVGYVARTTINNLTIAMASRVNGTLGATGVIQTCTDDSLRYSAPGGEWGEEVTILNGETKTLFDGSDQSKWVRVTRTSASAFVGSMYLEFVDQYANVFGQTDAPDAEQAAGSTHVRAVMLMNSVVAPVLDVKLYIKTLTSTVTTSAGQLGATGAGTITGATDCFLAWPERGWARIVQSNGTLREIVFYSSRSASALTVPALGRSLLGTTNAAGASTDTVVAVPPIRIGYESPSPSITGPIQTIANESTIPSGVTWSSGTTAATGIAPGNLIMNQQVGIWIRRELPAGVSAWPKYFSYVGVEFSVGGTTYSETLAGLFRVADDDLERYEIRVGVGSAPALSASPVETFTSLPHNTTYALTNNATNYVSVDKRNKYDLVAQSINPTVIKLSSGSVVTVNPSSPEVQDFSPAVGGKFRVRALYYPYSDGANSATVWLIYLRTNGTNPDPSVDTPVEETMVLPGGVPAFLDYTTPLGYADGTTGKVIVRVRRTSPTSDSTNSDIWTATADATGPAAPSAGLFYRKIAQQKGT